MTQISDVRYAQSGDVSIAYQVVGEGPLDLVFVRGITGDILSTWEQPLLARHVLGLAENGRLMLLDKRGTGLSDGSPASPRSRPGWTTFAPSWMPWGRSRPSCGAGRRQPDDDAVRRHVSRADRRAGRPEPIRQGRPTADYPWAPSDAAWREP